MCSRSGRRWAYRVYIRKYQGGGMHPEKKNRGRRSICSWTAQDRCINICEMKFAGEEFVIDKKYASELDLKIKVFKEKTKSKKTIFLTMITTYGVKQNIYYTGRIVSEVKMEELFK